METNKKLLANVFLSLVGIVAFSLAVMSRNENVFRDVRGEYIPSSIVLETNKNKIGVGAFSPTTTYSGNGFATTELGNPIAFEYNSLYNPTNYWQTIKAGGYITNTQPIMGMSSISLTKSGTTGNFGVYWSNTKTFTSERYVQFDTSSPLNVTTDFAGYMPNYIKIVAIANTSIVRGVIEFSCADNYALSYDVVVTSENLEMGTVSGSGQYDYDESVTITATPNHGYEFIGWYQDSTLISSLSTYIFLMPSNSLNYVAKFNPLSYVLELISEDTNKGTVSGAGTYPYKQSRSITATPQSGYSFVGWFEGETLVSSDNPYTFNMPYNNLSYVAKFSTNSYVLTLASNDINKGTVVGEGTFAYQSEVTITATPTEGNWFKAWYDDSFNEVSTNASYTFTMPEYDVTYYAEFTNVQPLIKGKTYTFGTYPQSIVTDSTLLSTLNSAHGTLPTSTNSQAWTSYGYYIDHSAATSYMWYIDLMISGDEYRGVYFTSYRPYYTTITSSTANSYQDDNGYATSNVYWFKYEPITWRVLDVQAGKALLMANLVLDSQDYHYFTSTRTIGGSTVYSNNYKESLIRSWLNSNFYNAAFTTAEQARIQTTTVDNSVASTGYSSNPYVCANTSDKVFLLSYAEATSATYGLSTTTSRQLGPSAYAKAQGVYTNTNGFNYWWLRSPYYYRDIYARSVRNDGDVEGNNNVSFTRIGVVPALWISLQGNQNPRSESKWPQRDHFVIAKAVLK